MFRWNKGKSFDIGFQLESFDTMNLDTLVLIADDGIISCRITFEIIFNLYTTYEVNFPIYDNVSQSQVWFIFSLDCFIDLVDLYLSYFYFYFSQTQISLEIIIIIRIVSLSRFF